MHYFEVKSFPFLTLSHDIDQNQEMKRPILTALILFAIGGCDDEKNLSPPFPEMDNPLDEDSFLQRILQEATDAEDLTRVMDGERERYLDANESGFSGWVRKSYSGGSLGYLFQCREGVQDGLHTAWHENGRKMVERQWKEGLRDGPFVTWTAAGALESRGFNSKNLRHGQFEEFYSNGQRKTDAQYENGKLDRLSRWMPDGSLCPNTKVKEGAGLVVDYEEDGSVDSNHSYANGELDYGYSRELPDTVVLEEGEVLVEKVEGNSSLAD